MKETYFIQTFGCQMNKADSERIAGAYELKGYKRAGSIKDADVVVINTCSVRQTAEDRVLGLVNNLSKFSKKPKIILTGCMLRYTLYQLRRMLPQVDEFIKLKDLTHRLQSEIPQSPYWGMSGRSSNGGVAQPRVKNPPAIRLSSSALSSLPKGSSSKSSALGEASIRNSPFRRNPPFAIRNSKVHAWVPIMEGCDNFCTYCVVPYARGRERSKPLKEVVCEVKELVNRGYKEITLLGQNVNSYKPGFAKLLIELHKIKGLGKIKFITSNPQDLTDDIIQAMKLPKIDRYLHLPAQSGDDKILKKMNRKYTAKQYLDLIKRIRKEIPEIEIGTDVIVGFPTETKEQFQHTVDLCKKAKFKVAYIAKYSPRPGTAAYKLADSVLPQEKKRRWEILDKLIN